MLPEKLQIKMLLRLSKKKVVDKQKKNYCKYLFNTFWVCFIILLLKQQPQAI